MKVVVFSEYYPPYIGGAENIISHLAEGLAARGFSVHVITSFLPATRLKEEVNGVKVHRVTQVFGRYSYPLASLKQGMDICRDADIAITATFISAFAPIIPVSLRRVPLILIVYEAFGGRWHEFEKGPKSTIFKLGEKLMLSFPYAKIVAVCNSTKESLLTLGVSQSKLTTIYPGVDFVNYPISHERIDDKVYAFFGRPGFTKGVEYLLSAARLVKNEIPDSKLVMFLAKEPRSRYNAIVRLIDEWKLWDCVDLQSPVPHATIPKVIQPYNVVVVPSIAEGFGGSASEASALGKAVVATRAGGLPEIIVDEQTGILVEPRNPQKLAEAITYLLKNPDYARDLGKRGREYVKRFSWDRMVDEYVRLIESVVGNL